MPSLDWFQQLFDLIKKTYFQKLFKLIIRINRKFPYEILTFFLGKLYQKFFLFYNLITHGTLDTEFG